MQYGTSYTKCIYDVYITLFRHSLGVCLGLKSNIVSKHLWILNVIKLALLFWSSFDKSTHLHKTLYIVHFFHICVSVIYWKQKQSAVHDIF